MGTFFGIRSEINSNIFFKAYDKLWYKIYIAFIFFGLEKTLFAHCFFSTQRSFALSIKVLAIQSPDPISTLQKGQKKCSKRKKSEEMVRLLVYRTQTNSTRANWWWYIVLWFLTQQKNPKQK
jgi:hypothetical protein